MYTKSNTAEPAIEFLRSLRSLLLDHFLPCRRPQKKRAPAKAGARLGFKFRLERANAGRFRTLASLALLERHLLAIRKRAETLGVDVRVMDEQITAAVIRRDESITLLLVEPLH